MIAESRSWTVLNDRRIVEVRGADRRTFLQGLISNDIDTCTPTHAIYAALLTPQGKYLADFVIVDAGDGFLLDVPADRASLLLQRLTLYKLRAAVELTERTDLKVAAGFGQTELGERGAAHVEGETVVIVDPRLATLGERCIATPERLAEWGQTWGSRTDLAAYHSHRLAIGVPEGGSDLVPDRGLLLESGFVELAGVSFEKGCFVGQELTARMRYRATVRKRLLPVRFTGPTPAAGTPIHADAIEVGEVRSSAGTRGIALIRLDRWRAAAAQGTGLQAGEAVTVEPEVPDWMDLSIGAADKAAESSA